MNAQKALFKRLFSAPAEEPSPLSSASPPAFNPPKFSLAHKFGRAVGAAQLVTHVPDSESPPQSTQQAEVVDEEPSFSESISEASLSDASRDAMTREPESPPLLSTANSHQPADQGEGQSPAPASARVFEAFEQVCATRQGKFQLHRNLCDFSGRLEATSRAMLAVQNSLDLALLSLDEKIGMLSAHVSLYKANRILFIYRRELMFAAEVHNFHLDLLMWRDRDARAIDLREAER